MIGTGNSGHDMPRICTRAARCHAGATQLNEIVNVEPSAQLPYALYDEGPSLEDCDLITTSIPLAALAEEPHLLTEQGGRSTSRCSTGSSGRFQLDFGEDGSGWQLKYLDPRRRLLFQRRLFRPDRRRQDRSRAVFRHRKFRRRRRADAQWRDPPADLIVLATGYKGAGTPCAQTVRR